MDRLPTLAAQGNRKSRFLLISGALILGLAGQSMLRNKDWVVPGAIFIGLAALFFVVAFGARPGVEIRLNTALWEGRSLHRKSFFWGVLTLGTAILFSALAFWLFGEDFPPYYPWLLHRWSIGLFLLSAFLFNRLKTPAGNGTESKDEGWRWLEVIILLVILVIAAFMRLYRSNEIPFGLWFDEADNGLSALDILASPESLPVFVKSTNLPAHFLYLISFSFQILGVSVFTIRIVGVVFGLATVVASFFLGSELFNRRLGLVFAFLIAVSRWDVNWSRIGMHGISVPFFEILSCLLVLRSMRTQNLVYYALAGLSLGLGLCFYTPLYFFPIVIAVFLLFLWTRRHNLVASSWRGFLFLALGFFMVSVPISQFAIRQSNSFDDRLRVTSIFTGKSPQEAWKAVARTTRDHLLMFNYHGDNNGRHNLPGEPMLDTISGVLMVLGLVLSLRRIRQPSSFLLVAWLLIMLMPGIFSLDFESPQSLRAIGSLPSAYLLALVPIHASWQEWEESPAKPAIGFIVPLVFILGAAGYTNYHIYFDLQSKRSDVWAVFSTPQTIIGKAMAGLDPQTDVYVSIIYNASPTIEFLSPNVTYDQLEVFDALPIPSDGGKTMVFFIEAAREQFLLQARRYYPNADFKEYKDPNGNAFLYQITLAPSDIEASQGITASYYRNANWREQPFLVKKEATINADWKDGVPAQFPFGVKWQGVLYADRYGLYRLTLHSPSPSELYLDNIRVHLEIEEEGTQTAKVELAKGCHDLVLTTLGKEGHFELDWMPPGEKKQTLIPSSNFFQPPISNNGLLGYYFANGDWQSPAAFLQVDPWINFNYQTQPLARPYTVEWVGRINIRKEGQYGFKLESIDESTLFIDDKPVTNAHKEGVIYLSQGFHPLRIRYADRSKHTYIHLYWNPGSGFESIPQEMLFLP
ncbi:Anti-sigma-I factor RsgI3 [Anaerolineales bacterium]|nr:Anti-sigma-I factor RsgI3 [Anaerolineales bacterium]